MKPLISIVCPTYNVEEYIINFSKSILNQTAENFELIFVNDGSTDNTQNLLETIRKTDSRVLIINKENEGAGEARNIGFSVSSGEYVLFADPDDTFEHNFINEIGSYLTKFEPEVTLFGYNTISIDGRKLKSISNNNQAFFKSKREFREAFSKIENENNYNSVWNKIYKTDFLKKTGIKFPKNPTAQDAIFNYRLINKINTLLVIPKYYYNYLTKRVGSAQNSSHKKYLDEYELMKQKIESFDSWDNVLSIPLSNQAVIDFLTTQIITYNGTVPRELKISKEFIEANELLKSIKINQENTLVNNLKIFLLKNNQYKILYQIYKIII